MTSQDSMSGGHPLAILGAGVMGETVLSGLLRAGWHADQIVATDRRLERQLELTTRYGIKMLENTEAVAEAETVILVVKPGHERPAHGNRGVDQARHARGVARRRN